MISAGLLLLGFAAAQFHGATAPILPPETSGAAVATADLATIVGSSAQFQPAPAPALPPPTPGAPAQSAGLDATVVAAIPLQAAAATPPPASSAPAQKVDAKANSGAPGPIKATATTGINLRAGPGQQYDVLAGIRINAALTVTGCLKTGKWCKVDAGSVQGWAYSQYLATDLAGARLMVGDQIAALGIPVAKFSAPPPERPWWWPMPGGNVTAPGTTGSATR
jgi:uncharacterized protein YraI